MIRFVVPSVRFVSEAMTSATRTTTSALAPAAARRSGSATCSGLHRLRLERQAVPTRSRAVAVAEASARAAARRRMASAALRDREYFVPQRSAPMLSRWPRGIVPQGLSGDRAVGALLAANISVFAAWQLAEGGAARRFMHRNFLCSDAAVTHEWRVHTLITCAFSHVEVWHLVSNMVALYFFGRSVGQHIGGRRLLYLYATGGVIGSAAHILYYRLSAQSERRRRRQRFGGDFFIYDHFRDSPPVLGASAAINAIVAYDVLLNPMKIIMVNLVIPMPAAVLGGLFLSRDIFFALNGGATTRESHAAHIAGAGVGSIAYLLLSRGRGRM